MGKQNNTPNRIQLSQDDIDNAEQKSLEQASISFFNNTKASTKGIGDMLSTPSRIPVQGRVRDNETHFIDMSKFSTYLFPEKKGDYAFPFEADIDRERALKQSNWEQTKNVALKVLPNAA